jgi:MFS transporter, DHA1 family, multidrug resistance protein
MNMSSEHWKKNLVAIAISQFLVISGFQSILSFMPLFIQQLGNFSNTEAVFWTGIAVGGSGIAMFIFSPIWGMTADRWGRKPMLLRAQLGGSIILGIMAFAPNYMTIVILRIIQGAFTGTVAAASALVTSQTPKDKLPWAIGMLMAAVFSGSTLGPLYGGFLADHFGYEVTLIVIAIMLFIGSVIIFFFTSEKFEKPEKVKGISLKDMWQMASSPKMANLLVIITVIYAGPQMVTPIIPMTFREVDPNGRTASQAGIALGILGLLSVFSSLAAGRLSSRMSIKKMLLISCIVTGLLYLPPIWATTTFQLIITIGIIGLFRGGLQTSTSTMVSQIVPTERQGLAYGLVASANALGMGLGSFTGGSLATLIGMRPMFAVTAAFFLVLIVLIPRLHTE